MGTPDGQLECVLVPTSFIVAMSGAVVIVVLIVVFVAVYQIKPGSFRFELSIVKLLKLSIESYDPRNDGGKNP
jgi:hypothetical protein